MKSKSENRKLNVKFGSRTRFRVAPEPKRAKTTEALENLKAKLVRETLSRIEDLAMHPAFRRAADEAASLAWVHPYPLLAFPVLLDEKGRVALHWARRQREILERSQAVMVLAE